MKVGVEAYCCRKVLDLVGWKIGCEGVRLAGGAAGNRE